MEKIEIANMVLYHFIRAGYKTYMDLRNSDDVESTIVFQLDIGLDPIGSFAFFFSVNDDDPDVEFCCVYEFDKPVSKEAFEEFKKEHKDDLGVFDELIYSPEDSTIHLYAKKDQYTFSELILEQVEAAFADPFGIPALVRKLGEGNLGA